MSGRAGAITPHWPPLHFTIFCFKDFNLHMLIVHHGFVLTPSCMHIMCLIMLTPDYFLWSHPNLLIPLFPISSPSFKMFPHLLGETNEYN